MTTFDIILLIILGGFVLSGLWFGFIHAVGALIGVVAGAWAAGGYYNAWGIWISSIFGFGAIANVIAFVIIFIVVNRLVGLVFWIIDRAFKIISIIPFLKTINRLAGALLGFVEGVLVLGLVLYVLGRYSISSNLDLWLSASPVAHWLVGVAKILEPLLPELLKKLQSVI